MCSAASKMPPFELAWVPNKHQGVNARSSFRGALISATCVANGLHVRANVFFYFFVCGFLYDFTHLKSRTISSRRNITA